MKRKNVAKTGPKHFAATRLVSVDEMDPQRFGMTGIADSNLYAREPAGRSL